MMGVTDAVRPRPLVAATVGLLLCALLVVVAAPVAATTCDADDSGCERVEEATAGEGGTDEPSPEPTDGHVAQLALEVTPVVGDGPDDGDLVRDDETGLATLTFSSSTPQEQVAVYEYTATNTGDAPLHDLEITDDRLGTVLPATEGTSLAPGETTTLRASAMFTMREVAGGLAGLLTSTATATATDDDGATVSGQDDAVVQLVAVLAALQANLQLEVVRGAGDVIDQGGVATMVWAAEDVAAGEARTVRYRVTVTNTGPVTLHAIEVTLDVLATPVVAAADGRTLEPGESLTVEVDRQLVPEDVPEGTTTADGDVEAELPALASLHAIDDTGIQEVTAIDEALVHVHLLATGVRGEVLPATGPRDADGLLPTALLLLWTGVALLGIGQPGRVRSVRS